MLRQEQAAGERLEGVRREMTEERERIDKEHRTLKANLRDELTKVERDAATRVEALHLEMAQREEEAARAHETREQSLREELQGVRASLERLQKELFDRERVLSERTDKAVETMRLVLREVEAREQAAHKRADILEGELKDARALERNLREEIANRSVEAGSVLRELQRLKSSMAWKIAYPARWLEGRLGRFVYGGVHSPSHGGDGEDRSLREREMTTRIGPDGEFRRALSTQQMTMNRAEGAGGPSGDATRGVGLIQDVGRLLSLQGDEFVQAVYRSILKRAPDPEGLRYYVGRLRAGFGKSSVIAQIASSAEARAVNAGSEGLARLVRRHRRAKYLHWHWFGLPRRIPLALSRLDKVFLEGVENLKRLPRKIDETLRKRVGMPERGLDDESARRERNSEEGGFVPRGGGAKRSLIEKINFPSGKDGSSMIAEIEARVRASSEVAELAKRRQRTAIEGDR
jgi:hypothetical protein